MTNPSSQRAYQDVCETCLAEEQKFYRAREDIRKSYQCLVRYLGNEISIGPKNKSENSINVWLRSWGMKMPWFQRGHQKIISMVGWVS